MSAARLSAVLLLLAACTPEPHRVDWIMTVHPDVETGGLARVHACIRKGDCATAGACLYTQTFGWDREAMRLRTEGHEAPGALAPGAYAFELTARDGECLEVAHGCVETTLNDDDDVTVAVLLEPVAQAACACRSGVCEGNGACGTGSPAEAEVSILDGTGWDAAEAADGEGSTLYIAGHTSALTGLCDTPPVGGAGPAWTPFVAQASVSGCGPWLEVTRAEGYGAVAHAVAAATTAGGESIAYGGGAFSSNLYVSAEPIRVRGRWDGFVLGYDGSGNLGRALVIAGSADDGVESLAADPGRVVIGGQLSGDAEVTEVGVALAQVVPSHGAEDGFVIVADHEPAGSLTALAIGGPEDDTVTAVLLGRGDLAVAAGSFRDELIAGTVTLVSEGGADAFVVALDARSAEPLWGVRYGASGADEVASSLAEGPDGTLWAGVNRGSDAAVLEIDPGGTLRRSIEISEPGTSISVDALAIANGDLYVGGDFEGVLPFGPPVASRDVDAYVARLDLAPGCHPALAVTLGGAAGTEWWQVDNLHGLAALGGEVIAVGHVFGEASLHVDGEPAGAFVDASTGDAFVVRIRP